MIFLYHHVIPPEAIPPKETQTPIEGWEWSLSPHAFRAQLIALQKRGFKFISLNELVDRLLSGKNERPRDAVITFDDGWMDNYQYAFPVLKELDIPASFFIATGDMETNSHKMKASHLRELAAAGMAIGGHTRSHPDLTSVNRDMVLYEMHGCREDLQSIINDPIRFFAYPGGAFNQSVAACAKEVGYDAACSIIGGGRNSANNRYWLYRTVLSEPFGSWRNRALLSRSLNRLLNRRAAKRVRQALG